MYTTNFIANSDYLIKYLLQHNGLNNDEQLNEYSCEIEPDGRKDELNSRKDELDSRKLAYDIVNEAVDKIQIISEYPRIVAQIRNIGKFPLEEMLPMVNNISLKRRPTSVCRPDVFHSDTKADYLNRVAVNYMIIGKPGNRAIKLAEKLEEEFKCVHIDCNQLVEREIQSKSRLGLWLNKNLQLNKILPIEIILWLIQRETISSKIIYRGYILTGLPLVPNMDLNVQKNFLTEEEFLMFLQIVDEIIDIPIKKRETELAKLKKKLFSEYPILADDPDEFKEDPPMQTDIPEKIRPVPTLFHRISCDADVRFSIKRQLFFALDLVNKPTLVIYLDCDDEDVITKNIVFNNETPDGLKGIRIALKRYNNALDVIQEFICHIPNRNLIYCLDIDTLDEIFKNCSNNIKECGIRKVYVADDFYEMFKDDVSIIEQLEATSNPHDILHILRLINPINKNLGWFSSSFEIKCPVMSTQGKVVLGKYQHSVLFTGIIYLLSSEENKRKFIENPQFFTRAKPTCRVGIMGPRCSGKSTFARCLAKFFDNAIVFDVNYLFDYYKRTDVTRLYYAQTLEHVITKLNSQLLDKYKEEQQVQEDKINDWIGSMRHTITSFLKPIPTKKGKNKKKAPIPDKNAVHEHERLKNILNEFGFETDNHVLLRTYLSSKELFMNKVPPDIRKGNIYREPQPNDIDVQKFVKERMNELSKDYILPMARKIEILVTKIRLCEKRQQLLTKQNKLYGYWILDGLPPDTELIESLKEMDCLPDVIVYMDDSVGDRLAENQNIKCHREFLDMDYVIGTILNINKFFFKHMLKKIPEIRENSIFKSQLVRREIDHILLQESLHGTTDYHDENEKYRENFDQVKSILKPHETHLVLVDMHNKSWSQTLICGLKGYMNYFHAYAHVLANNSIKDGEPSDKLIRTGTTAEYCPVLFVDNMMLKLGVPQYPVQLKNRTYWLSSEEALQKFVEDPYRYSELERPFQIPPYRLCVIGNYHAAKRGDLRRIAEILGTKHLTIENIINSHFVNTRSDRNYNITTFKETLEYLSDRLVNDLVAPLFDEGFLFEDFPLTAGQLHQMVKLNKFPEQIFYIKIENDHLMNEELNFYLQLYNDVLLKKVTACKLQNDDWKTQRKSRFDELFAELSDDIVVEEEEEDSNYVDRLDPEILTDILKSFDVSVDSDREKQLRQLYVADMVNEEMPPDQYKNLIDELLKISANVEVKHLLQHQLVEYEKIKLAAEEHLIPFIQIRIHPYTTKEIEKSILKNIKESTDRQYLFDRTHPISYENAVDYIRQGQFMFSRYFMNCPVRNLNMDYPVHLMLSTPDLGEKLQPFIYQENIYFVQRVNQNVEEFIARPYLFSCPSNVYQITKSIGIAVHGPRNSGCQTLCNRISKEFQINSFSLDGMKEYVVKKFKWTKLATELIKNGMEITNNQQICDLVKIATNYEIHGWILHDVPLNTDLIKCFILNSLHMNLIIYLEPTGTDLWNNIKNKYNSEKCKRKMDVLQHLYGMISELEKFSGHSKCFTGLNRNVLTIKNFTSNWNVWNEVYREILLLLRLYNLYELRGIEITAGSLYKLDFTEYELEYRLGPLKLCCPMCWLQNKLLVKYRYCYIDDKEAEPLYTDNLYDKNLFQFRKYFYWSCNTHLVELMTNAESYLQAISENVPDEFPELIKEWQESMILTNRGYCPVAYNESGNTEIQIGLPEYSVLYYNKIYIMSSKSNCLLFIQNPAKYKDVEIAFVVSNRSSIDEDFNNMKLDFGSITPVLIINALLECAFERPKHFNLEPDQSLEVYLGLYLKTHNTNSSNSKLESYKSMFLKYWEDCKLVQRKINEMQMTGNPFIFRGPKRSSAEHFSGSAFGF